MSDPLDLDHIGLAATETTPLWAVLAGDLAGRWVENGCLCPDPGHGQLRFTSGMKIEVSRGPVGAHLTFVVSDIEAAAEQLLGAGYQVSWLAEAGPSRRRVAQLDPRQTTGLVVRLAAPNHVAAPTRPPGLPQPRVHTPAELVHVAHSVADLEGALALFKSLGGISENAGAGGGVGWVDLAWPGPGRLRLMGGEALRGWLGTEPGRLHHLGWRVENPGGVGGAVERDGWWEIPAESPVGTRILLAAPGDSLPLVM